jgi:hypothetical protein
MGVKNKIAEVIAGNNREFTAQCYQLNTAPPLGSLVKTRLGENGKIFGVVYLVETHGLEPGRRVFVRGGKLENEEEIYRENPQLEKLLVTDFNVLVLGYSEEGHIHHFLPPQPPPVHSFVYVCDENEMLDFTSSLNCLGLLADSQISVPVDEVIAAFLRNISKCHKDPHDFLVKAGKELVWVYGSDIRRLNSLLKRLSYAD